MNEFFCAVVVNTLVCLYKDKEAHLSQVIDAVYL